MRACNHPTPAPSTRFGFSPPFFLSVRVPAVWCIPSGYTPSASLTKPAGEDARNGMKGPRCVMPDCPAVASRALPGNTNGLFCIRHAQEDMVNVINWTECARDGCEKYPTYGARGSNNREYCAEHALSDMVDVHRKKCAVEGCPRRASHGVRGSGRREFCGQHAAIDMVIVAGRLRLYLSLQYRNSF